MSTPVPLNNTLRAPDTAVLESSKINTKRSILTKNPQHIADLPTQQSNTTHNNSNIINMSTPTKNTKNINNSCNNNTDNTLTGLEAVLNLSNLNSTVAKPNTHKLFETNINNQSSENQRNQETDPYDITAATDIDPALYSLNYNNFENNSLSHFNMDSGLAPELRPNPRQQFTVHTGAHHTINELQMPGNVTLRQKQYVEVVYRNDDNRSTEEILNDHQTLSSIAMGINLSGQDPNKIVVEEESSNNDPIGPVPPALNTPIVTNNQNNIKNEITEGNVEMTKSTTVVSKQTNYKLSDIQPVGFLQDLVINTCSFPSNPKNDDLQNKKHVENFLVNPNSLLSNSVEQNQCNQILQNLVGEINENNNKIQPQVSQSSNNNNTNLQQFTSSKPQAYRTTSSTSTNIYQPTINVAQVQNNPTTTIIQNIQLPPPPKIQKMTTTYNLPIKHEIKQQQQHEIQQKITTNSSSTASTNNTHIINPLPPKIINNIQQQPQIQTVSSLLQQQQQTTVQTGVSLQVSQNLQTLAQNSQNKLNQMQNLVQNTIGSQNTISHVQKLQYQAQHQQICKKENKLSQKRLSPVNPPNNVASDLSVTSSLSPKDNISPKNNNSTSPNNNSREKKFKCSIKLDNGEECPKRFCRKDELRRHERTHTKDRKFLCPHYGCGRTFARSDHLTTHMRTHTGNKPYICLYYSDTTGTNRCTKTFARSDERVRHHSTHERRNHCKLSDEQIAADPHEQKRLKQRSQNNRCTNLQYMIRAENAEKREQQHAKQQVNSIQSFQKNEKFDFVKN